jgi:tRNA (mo5U34)-methyltransferase
MTASGSALERVNAVPLWYHTIEVSPGVVTPGWFDLRAVSGTWPWPDVQGKRCLDVGTADGFLAFELEDRGAAEVVAIDLADHGDWDYAARDQAGTAAYTASVFGAEKGTGFRTAHALRGSKVRYEQLSAYDLSPERLGTFDVVVCGSLMLHLKDPVRALEAIRSVCTGAFLSSEQIDAILTLTSFRRPAAQVRGGVVTQWFVPNPWGHRAMVRAAGFEIEATTRPYAIGFGASHPPRSASLRSIPGRLATRLVTGGGVGVTHAALRARPV